MSRTFVTAVLVVMLGLLGVMSFVVRATVRPPEPEPPDPAQVAAAQRQHNEDRKRLEEQAREQAQAAQAQAQQQPPAAALQEMDLAENWHLRRQDGEEGVRLMRKVQAREAAELEAAVRRGPAKIAVPVTPAAPTAPEPQSAAP
ncbi:MAG TPA: hypothetical protein VLH79_01575 [Chthonomonadales bacterium]|nr:hypothetical protein [Chthonomonadales bacterium]